ncbi:hypothetical protein GOP47_0011622 [Adiantum capillus-veneris]|uniref:Uncharacterized protein n=1 Tax=Adiantum capillus-veneris TaxID=13818 RepID=A0A9D4UT50_ADICA|nr:hypothetical protein GOP47_0011622 [Adiantum capillus-veneris]
MGMLSKNKDDYGEAPMPSSSEFHAFNDVEPTASPISAEPDAAVGLSSGDDEDEAPDVYTRRPLLPLKPPTSPRSTFTLSMFGRQVLSQRKTGPTICFGTADRATGEKQYYSQEMDKARAGLEGPGGSTKAIIPRSWLSFVKEVQYGILSTIQLLTLENVLNFF